MERRERRRSVCLCVWGEGERERAARREEEGGRGVIKKCLVYSTHET